MEKTIDMQTSGKKNEIKRGGGGYKVHSQCLLKTENKFKKGLRK